MSFVRAMRLRPRGTGAPWHAPGRVRYALAELLNAEGFAVLPDQLKAAQGFWRTSQLADVLRWEAYCQHKDFPASLLVWVLSYSPMSLCVQRGYLQQVARSE